MKKKLLALSVVMVLLAIAVVGGSLAWFTDTDEVQNTFTVGSVKIEQIEVFDENAAQLLPVVGTDPADATDNYIEKKVTVQNTGKNSAYIQTFVAAPYDLVEKGALHMIWNSNATDYTVERVSVDTDISGIKHAVYRFRYNAVLEPNATTPESLQYVYIDKAANVYTEDSNQDNVTDIVYLTMNDQKIEVNIVNGLNIYVASQAVQAEGFTGTTTAETAATALDAAFGAGKNPWTPANP